MARPTKYDPSFPEELLLYFSVKPYFKKTKPLYDEDGEVLEEQETVSTEVSDFPSFAGFAAQIGVHRDTLHEWCEKHPEFSDAYKKAKELQENWLLINGMKDHVNTAFAIFTLKNCCDYRDKKSIEHEGGDPKKPITVQPFDLKERIEQLESGDGE